MPTFSQSQPRSISTAVASLLSSSPNLSSEDMIKLDQLASQANYRDTMTEKVRQEMAQARDAQRFRTDPQVRHEQARINAGLTGTQADVLRQNVEGVPMPLQGPTPEGPALEGTFQNYPDIPKQYGVTPAQQAAYRNSIGANVAAQMATGQTNAQQLTAAQGNLQQQDLTRRIEDETDPIKRQFLHEARPGLDYRTNAQGVTTGPSGLTEATTQSPSMIARNTLLAAQAEAARARTGTSQATTRLREAQTGQVGKPRPAAPPRPPAPKTPDQQRADTARADSAEIKARADKLKETEQLKTLSKNEFRRLQRSKEVLKDDKIGQWDETKGGFQILDKNGKVKGWATP